MQRLPCKQGSIAKSLDEAFSNHIEVSDGTWLFNTGQYYWKARVDYLIYSPTVAMEHGIVDLAWFLEGELSALEAIQRFADQFRFIRSRWPGYHDGLASIIVNAIARYSQSDIGLSLLESGVEALPNGSSLLFALRALIRSQCLTAFVEYTPFWGFVDDDFSQDNGLMVKGQLKQVQNPSPHAVLVPEIELQRMP